MTTYRASEGDRVRLIAHSTTDGLVRVLPLGALGTVLDNDSTWPDVDFDGYGVKTVTASNLERVTEEPTPEPAAPQEPAEGFLDPVQATRYRALASVAALGISHGIEEHLRLAAFVLTGYVGPLEEVGAAQEDAAPEEPAPLKRGDRVRVKETGGSAYGIGGRHEPGRIFTVRAPEGEPDTDVIDEDGDLRVETLAGHVAWVRPQDVERV